MTKNPVTEEMRWSLLGRWIRYAARVMALVGAAGILGFGLAGGEPAHIAAGVLFLVATGVTWRWEALGGVILVVAGYPLLFFAIVAQLWPEAHFPLSHLFATALPPLAGLLFILNWAIPRVAALRPRKRAVVLVAAGVALAAGCAWCCRSSGDRSEWQPPLPQAEGVRQLSPEGEEWSHVTGLTWSPDGAGMALTWSTGSWALNVVPKGYLYVLDLERGEPRVLPRTEVEAPRGPPRAGSPFGSMTHTEKRPASGSPTPATAGASTSPGARRAPGRRTAIAWPSPMGMQRTNTR